MAFNIHKQIHAKIIGLWATITRPEPTSFGIELVI